MQSMTIEQLRATNVAGGVTGVTLKGVGGTFLVEIATRSGTAAVLTKARSLEPRRFDNPLAALSVLRGVGISVGCFDASAWDPAEKVEATGDQRRAEAIRKAHRAAHSDWLAAEIQDSLDDPRPNLSHDELMADLREDLTELATGSGLT
ncbi:hypothetical protein WYO_4358 [Methylobacterium sp. GXF4]|uniref:antitoxin PaaA2 family protein n=1 Tax=Methylobacterium sp. GXF4 TaxID=1096546 RepID=UPI0002698382|nr:hypothetical protein [Methylobacterium sp. GXF4]EIZ83065.1 hypothetical protein WYO_4358 [Methylobacterium sp. GXF4]